MEIKYQEVTMDEVMTHFVNGYTFPADTSLWRHEYFYDANKNKVVVKLFLTKLSDDLSTPLAKATEA